MVVATLGTMAGLDGDAILDGSADAGDQAAFEAMLGTMTPAAMFAYMAFNLFCVPCMAAVGAAIGELNSPKKSAVAIGFWLITAYVVSFTVFWLGNFNTYMFPLSICVAVALVALTAFLITRRVLNYKKTKAALQAAQAATTVDGSDENEKDVTEADK